jgi:hypothetical protein
MPTLTGRQVILLLACLLTIAIACFGAYGLARGQAETPASETSPPVRRPEHADMSLAPVGPHDRGLPQTSEPVAYARAIASSLFTWDTSAGLLPMDYTDAVLADADPSGEETAGLVTDVAAYLPTTDQWLDLGAMEVTQSLTIAEATVPDAWSSAVEQARGHLRPGTTAVTITGTRHRTGVWNGEPAESAYPVSFTVFVACPPAFDRCHVLRLSQLDNPLR